MAIKTINPKDIPVRELHPLLLGAIAPRPIAFVSSVDKDGNRNLAPFSFFNAFGSNPPTVIFSPAISGRNLTTKNTFDNVLEVDEVVINVVTYAMKNQMNLASAEFAKGVNEFEKSGFTPIPSELVKPPRVKESPVQMECRVKQVIQTGTGGGAGNLVICEILLIHISEEIFTGDAIDPHKIDLIARMGGNYYARASGDAVFELPKPSFSEAVGVGAIPSAIRNSKILTGNDLGLLGAVSTLPSEDEIKIFHVEDEEWKQIYDGFCAEPEKFEKEVHQYAKRLLQEQQVEQAWKALLSIEKVKLK